MGGKSNVIKVGSPAIKDRFRDTILGRNTARVDVPLVYRRSLRDEAEILHQLANTLTRLSLCGPGETLTDQSALVLAQSAIFGAQRAMNRIKKEDEATYKRETVPKWGVEHVDNDDASKA